MTEPNFSYTQQKNMDGTNNSRPPHLTDEEKEQLKQELQKTESEIATLKIVLQTRIKEANDLKRRLGLTPWQELADDVNQGFSKVKQSDAFNRTNELLHQAGGKVTHTLGQIRNSSLFKSVEDKVGSAYTNVKAKMTPSSSTNFSAHDQNNSPAAGTPVSPITEKPIPK